MGRKLYIDDTKAFGIFLVIFAHQQIPLWLSQLIFSFHMPLFFIISGLFFNPSKTLKSNLISAIRTLLIPYLCFEILNISICWTHPYAHPEIYYGMKGFDMFKNAFFGIFLGVDRVTPKSYLPIGPLWFLVALFWVRVISSIIFYVVKNKLASILIVLLLPFVLCMAYIETFSIASALFSTPFYMFGFIFSELTRKFKIHSIVKLLVVVVSLFTFTLSLYNGHVDIDAVQMGNNLFLTYTIACVNSVSVIVIFKCISRYLPSQIHLIGAATLAILGIHTFPSLMMKIVAKLWVPANICSSVLYSFVFSVVVLYVSLLLSIAISKYAPFMLGKFK